MVREDGKPEKRSAVRLSGSSAVREFGCTVTERSVRLDGSIAARLETETSKAERWQ